ncbi:hypothetical protein TRFO_14645 [Tritrichomonas foetus]|uniref:Uncharacterized protein n=1 Tax=Tritrichomonas foetus TaxID=1144522 RepID=A0A1J4KV15_9EUKA|nr:hypothetical protein TRFO_14645 [Tritrichomonas foetus]|eukprot:OHT14978.1 hypothetical protein TRFO_14645 [Tritrichomonas foetus]
MTESDALQSSGGDDKVHSGPTMTDSSTFSEEAKSDLHQENFEDPAGKTVNGENETIQATVEKEFHDEKSEKNAENHIRENYSDNQENEATPTSQSNEIESNTINTDEIITEEPKHHQISSDNSNHQNETQDNAKIISERCEITNGNENPENITESNISIENGKFTHQKGSPDNSISSTENTLENDFPKENHSNIDNFDNSNTNDLKIGQKDEQECSPIPPEAVSDLNNIDSNESQIVEKNELPEEPPQNVIQKDNREENHQEKHEEKHEENHEQNHVENHEQNHVENHQENHEEKHEEKHEENHQEKHEQNHEENISPANFEEKVDNSEENSQTEAIPNQVKIPENLEDETSTETKENQGEEIQENESRNGPAENLHIENDDQEKVTFEKSVNEAKEIDNQEGKIDHEENQNLPKINPEMMETPTDSQIEHQTQHINQNSTENCQKVDENDQATENITETSSKTEHEIENPQSESSLLTNEQAQIHRVEAPVAPDQLTEEMINQISGIVTKQPISSYQSAFEILTEGGQVVKVIEEIIYEEEEEEEEEAQEPTKINRGQTKTLKDRNEGEKKGELVLKENKSSSSSSSDSLDTKNETNKSGKEDEANFKPVFKQKGGSSNSSSSSSSSTSSSTSSSSENEEADEIDTDDIDNIKSTTSSNSSSNNIKSVRSLNNFPIASNSTPSQPIRPPRSSPLSQNGPTLSPAREFDDLPPPKPTGWNAAAAQISPDDPLNGILADPNSSIVDILLNPSCVNFYRKRIPAIVDRFTCEDGVIEIINIFHKTKKRTILLTIFALFTNTNRALLESLTKSLRPIEEISKIIFDTDTDCLYRIGLLMQIIEKAASSWPDKLFRLFYESPTFWSVCLQNIDVDCIFRTLSTFVQNQDHAFLWGFLLSFLSPNDPQTIPPTKWNVGLESVQRCKTIQLNRKQKNKLIDLFKLFIVMTPYEKEFIDAITYELPTWFLQARTDDDFYTLIELSLVLPLPQKCTIDAALNIIKNYDINSMVVEKSVAYVSNCFDPIIVDQVVNYIFRVLTSCKNNFILNKTLDLIQQAFERLPAQKIFFCKAIQHSIAYHWNRRMPMNSLLRTYFIEIASVVGAIPSFYGWQSFMTQVVRPFKKNLKYPKDFEFEEEFMDESIIFSLGAKNEDRVHEIPMTQSYPVFRTLPMLIPGSIELLEIASNSLYAAFNQSELPENEESLTAREVQINPVTDVEKTSVSRVNQNVNNDSTDNTNVPNSGTCAATEKPKLVKKIMRKRCDSGIRIGPKPIAIELFETDQVPRRTYCPAFDAKGRHKKSKKFARKSANYKKKSCNVY